jgi:hypothetical protein
MAIRLRAAQVQRVGEIKNAYRILVGKPKEKKILGVARHM